jgi:hypothetical protein
MKRIAIYLAILAAVAFLFAPGFALISADAPPATPGLDYVAKLNGTNSAAYMARLQADLEAQGLQRMQDELYSAGNARSRTLATVHPRTRAAILYLLQLDGWIPDGSGTPPPPFDPAIADARIEGLGAAIPRQ